MLLQFFPAAEQTKIELQDANKCGLHGIVNGLRDTNFFGPHPRTFMQKVANVFGQTLGGSCRSDHTGNYHLDHLAQALRVKGFSFVLVTRNKGMGGLVFMCVMCVMCVCALDLLAILRNDMRKDVCCFIVHEDVHFTAIRFSEDVSRTPLYIDSLRKRPVCLKGDA